MPLDAARAAAMARAYQWHRPCWIVVDTLTRALVVFCGPHEEYLLAETARYYPLEIHHPDGSVVVAE